MQTVEQNIVSDCCNREIGQVTRIEYPLGGSTWGISYKVDVCTSCGKECEYVEECGNCGVVGCLGECEG